MNTDWFDTLPKVELHLHLEGAIPIAALWTLLQKYGGDPDVPDEEALQTRFAYRDFPHFIETWMWKNGFLREYEDFTMIAEAVARDLASQSIRYVEAHYSPPDFARHGLEPQQLTHAIRSGLDRVPGIEIALIADLCRSSSIPDTERRLDALLEVRDLGVVGIGIGGSEHQWPPEPFAPVYKRARRAGFHLTAHAGEAAGPASIWGAIRELGVERIGHGTRASEDPALLEYLVETKLPLEMCPISNVRTGVVPSLSEHPVRDYFDRGIIVTISTDDPKMFGTSLAEEYRSLATTHGFTREEIRRLLVNAIDSSWMPDGRKAALRKELEQQPV
jgi:adenosine deaminase